MYKRLILFSVFAVMAILFLSLFSPTSAYAMWIHPVVNGKVIYDDTPEIKWEYGDPGDDPHMGWDILGSSNKPSANARNNSFVYTSYENSELKTLVFQKKYIEWIIMRSLVDLFK